MTRNVATEMTPSRSEMLQAQGMMGLAFFLASWTWQDKPVDVLAIFAFCVFFATSVTTMLTLIEGRLHRDPGQLAKICLPATGIFGFSATLFFATGFAGVAVLVLLTGFALAAYRRHARDGAFNLIPSTALDMGLTSGLGATIAGLFLIVLGWTIA